MSTKMTPQLRFPEFIDEWQVKKLGDIAVFFDGKRVPIESAQRQTMSGEYPYYGASGIIDYVNDYIFDGEYVLLAEDGANIIMRSSPVAFIAKGKFWLNNHAHIMKAHGSNVFLATYLEMLRYDNYNTGTTQPKLNAAVVKKIKVATPSRPEQEKIADFLTAVDERIAVGEKKLELLETYKRGVMQKIFSQQVRFKDENSEDYPDWEEKKLGEIGKVITGKTPSTSEKSHWLGKVKFVTPTDMDGKKHQETSSRSVSYTGSLLLPEKSIMYTCIASIGKMSMSVGETITNQQINSFIPSKEICNDFAYYNLLWLTPRIVATQSNNTLPIINKSEFSKFKLLVPAKEEQQKIADFLTALDEKITAEKSKLTAARKFKKALLQRMFV